MIANIEIMPILYKFDELFDLDTFFSIESDKSSPIFIPIKTIKKEAKNGQKTRIFVKDSGIKSVIDTVIITPAAKAREDANILLLSFSFMNIKIVPSIVDKPANEVIKNGVLNIISPILIL